MRIALTLPAVLAVFCSAAAPIAHAQSSATKITVFHPALPSGTPAEGSCSGAANTVEDTNAWRCFKGNEIYDPCFSVKDSPGVVVCDSDPSSDKPGFLLKLKEPLPKHDSIDEAMAGRPWIMKLADGAVCRPMDGAVGTIAGLEVGFDCPGEKPCADDDTKCIHISVVDFKTGVTWMANEIRYQLEAHPKNDHDPWKLVARRKVPITQVWGSDKLSKPAK